jgi:spore maturation protein CgeB
MKIRLFYHSVISDWNHGNAHFLRGLVSELQARGHDVLVFEPVDGWSVRNLIEERGEAAVAAFQQAFPAIRFVRYDRRNFDVAGAVAEADLVIVHEWTEADIVQQVTAARRRHAFVVFFHDTHHRLVTDRESMPAHDFDAFDGVLAYGNVLRDLYQRDERVARVWTWHEAADTRIFHPRRRQPSEGDLVWIGNWGDDERTEELREFLINPVRELGLKARVYGVRYPAEARAALADAGIQYAGWLPNYEVPRVLARFKVTVHVPRRPYVEALPGIPTIRPFEALACGIPLLCSPWRDVEGLFRTGKDFLIARDGAEMKLLLRRLLSNSDVRRRLVLNGLETIRGRHTCAHRVDELLSIYQQVRRERGSIAASISSHHASLLQPTSVSSLSS